MKNLLQATGAEKFGFELLNFKGNDIETINYNGVQLFNPKHIGACLDITDSALRNHLAEMNEKQRIKLTNAMISNVLLTDNRKLHNTGEVFITESGVYNLLIKSRKPEAIAFQNWITDEVLPQIRQTGGYIPISEYDEEIDILKKSLEIAENTVKLMTQQLDNKELRIKRLENKSNAFEKLAINRDNMLLRDFLSEHNINMSDQSVFKKLTENGHIEKNEHNRYRKTEKLKEREATTGKEFFTLGGKNGDTLVVTPYGQAWLIHLCENKF